MTEQRPGRRSGTEGHGETADAPVAPDEGLAFDEVHQDTLPLIPAAGRIAAAAGGIVARRTLCGERLGGAT